MEAELEGRFERLLAELAGGAISFCVVGSFALAVHGAPRASADIDIVPETSLENLTRLSEVLERLGASRVPGDRPTPLPVTELGAAELKLYTGFGQLHLLGDVEGVPPFAELSRNAVVIEVEGESVMFCFRRAPQRLTPARRQVTAMDARWALSPPGPLRGITDAQSSRVCETRHRPALAIAGRSVWLGYRRACHL